MPVKFIHSYIQVIKILAIVSFEMELNEMEMQMQMIFFTAIVSRNILK